MHRASIPLIALLAGALSFSNLAAGQEPEAGIESEAESGAEPSETFREEIHVGLVSIKVRAVDHLSAPLPGLGPEDFRVRVGDEEVPVEAVDWIPAASGLRRELSGEQLVSLEEAGFEVPPEGRLVVLFVQTDKHAHRAVGLQWMLRKIPIFLGSLQPEDRVAVVSYDTHLKLRLDFTRDTAAILDALGAGVFHERRRPAKPSPRGPSLAAHFDPEAARDAGFVESGLEVTARALEPLAGEKLLVFLGWGLGGEHGGDPTPRYREALAALRAARVDLTAMSVAHLGPGPASNLDFSIQRLATDTGGVYAKLYPFHDLAMERLAKALDGYYVVTFQAPEVDRKRPVRITLREGPYSVLHQPLVLVPR